MAHVSAARTPTPIFPRGTTVLAYWLAHAEGLVVHPTGARVERVVAEPPNGQVESLIVRSRMTRRRKAIPAAAIAAVDPGAGTLHLEKPARHVRPSRAWAAATRAGGAGRRSGAHGARVTWTGTRTALAWARPRAAQATATSVRCGRLGAARSYAGAVWLAPRLERVARRVGATVERLVLAAAVAIARGIAWAAVRLEHAVERRRLSGRSSRRSA